MEVSREREKKSDTKEEGGGGCLERNLRWVLLGCCCSIFSQLKRE